jgi:hypothetical protein
MTVDERRVAKMLFGSEDVVVHQVNIAWGALVDLVLSAETAARDAALDEAALKCEFVGDFSRDQGSYSYWHIRVAEMTTRECADTIRALKRAPVPEPAPG